MRSQKSKLKSQKSLSFGAYPLSSKAYQLSPIGLLVACSLWLVATSMGQACWWSGRAANREFEREFRSFRYDIYQHFPDLNDSLLTLGGIMKRADSMCAGFLKQHRTELDGYFERKLSRLPQECRAVQTGQTSLTFPGYELRDSLVWGDTTALDIYFAQQKSLLKVMNCSPELMAASYRAMFLARSLDIGEYGRYQMLNTLGEPKLSRRVLGPGRVALVVDTWRDIVVITLVGSRGNYKTVRFDRYVRPRGVE